MSKKPGNNYTRIRQVVFLLHTLTSGFLINIDIIEWTKTFGYNNSILDNYSKMVGFCQNYKYSILKIYMFHSVQSSCPISRLFFQNFFPCNWFSFKLLRPQPIFKMAVLFLYLLFFLIHIIFKITSLVDPVLISFKIFIEYPFQQLCFNIRIVNIIFFFTPPVAVQFVYCYRPYAIFSYFLYICIFFRKSYIKIFLGQI